MSDIREDVRERYARAASSVQAAAPGATGSTCCDTDAASEASCCAGEGLGAVLYDDAARTDLPGTALEASLGCGDPTRVAELREGEVVLDLGSGGGIDVLLSARRVGPTGKVYGLDMTDEMLDLARENQKNAGIGNVEFLKGYIEGIPLPTSIVDVIISNCVINLASDKPVVFVEMYRVLKPGGRVAVTDVVASDDLDPAQRAERGSWVGCIAGALSFDEYRRGLMEAGFEDVTVTPTHGVADGIFSAIVRATKPLAFESVSLTPPRP